MNFNEARGICFQMTVTAAFQVKRLLARLPLAMVQDKPGGMVERVFSEGLKWHVMLSQRSNNDKAQAFVFPLLWGPQSCAHMYLRAHHVTKSELESRCLWTLASNPIIAYRHPFWSHSNTDLQLCFLVTPKKGLITECIPKIRTLAV